jgi:hypothetical protein
VLVVLFLISASFEARAAISVERADYKAGVLVVRGKTTEANETVTLDGKYRAYSNRSRKFQFRIGYRPRKCTVRLTAGSDIFHATVTHCKPMRSQVRPRGM